MVSRSYAHHLIFYHAPLYIRREALEAFPKPVSTNEDNTVNEFVGPQLKKVRTEFQEPREFEVGTWNELGETGCETAASGILWDTGLLLPLTVGEMIHLWCRAESRLSEDSLLSWTPDEVCVD